MVDYWNVEIESVNSKGKSWKDQMFCESYLDMVRTISGYKAKRGYELIKIDMVKVVKLF